MTPARMLVAALMLAGCGETLVATTVCETPAEVRLDIASGPLLNPDPSGAPLPTEVRVLALRDGAALENARFEDAWAPEGALAESIVSTQSVTLYPGETTSASLAPSAEAHAIVAMAIVRQPAGRTWRVIVPTTSLTCGHTAALALRVDEYRIERASETREP